MTRKSLFCPLLLWLCHLGCAGPAAAQVTFERHEVATGGARHQTVLTGFLLGGDVAELVVVDVDETQGRRLRIWVFADGTWTAGPEAALRPGVAFVDIANIGGRDRLITYESGRLNWFDPGSATERLLIEMEAGFKVIDQGEIPRVDITRDLNHDNRDDLLVPDLDGFWVSIQRSDGSFSDAVKLGPPEPFVDEVGVSESGVDRSRSYGEVGINRMTVPWYLSRVHEMDYDQDGRSDLVFWNEDHFEVHLQNGHGLFSAAAETFTTEAPFDSDGVYSLVFGFRDASAMSMILGCGEKTRLTVLHSLRDLDGDDVADLVTLTLSGRSPLRQRSLYEVYPGRPTADGIRFAKTPNTKIHPAGKAGGMQGWGYASQWFGDLDGDRQVDVMFRDVRVGIGGMLRALVGNSVPLDLEFYRMEDGVYAETPTARRRLRRFAPFAGLGNVFLPAVLLGDVNGDGRPDLLVGHSPKELRVFVGVPGPDPLARQPQKVAVALPHDERNSRLVDLDKDGKQDLLLHHTPTDRLPNRPHRLTVLIAR